MQRHKYGHFTTRTCLAALDATYFVWLCFKERVHIVAEVENADHTSVSQQSNGCFSCSSCLSSFKKKKKKRFYSLKDFF